MIYSAAFLAPCTLAASMAGLMASGCTSATPTVAESECFVVQNGESRQDCAESDPEPNDTIPMAATLADTSCDAMPVTGVLAGTDLDVFHAHGTLCEHTQPRLELDTPGVTACLFVQCSTGSTGISGCDDQSLVVHHPSGLYGCCRSSPGAVGLGTNCGTTRRSVHAFVIVQGNPPSCTPYSLRYHL